MAGPFLMEMRVMNAPMLTPPISRKMKKPERADYFRVFAAIMLLDDDYVDLTREQWGSVFLLMLTQWAKGGFLPGDHNKLAKIARCEPDELEELLRVWPKLKKIKGQPGKVGIPYLTQEYAEVMGYYEGQKIKGEKSAEAKMNNRNGQKQQDLDVNHGSTTDEPSINLLDVDVDVDVERDKDRALAQEEEEDVDVTVPPQPPPPPGSHTSVPSQEKEHPKNELSLMRVTLDGATLRLNQLRLDISTGNLNAALKEPWKVFNQIVDTTRKHIPGLPITPVGTLLTQIKNEFDQWCKDDPQWLMKTLGAADYMVINLPTGTYRPGLGHLLQDDAKLLNEYSAKFFHKKLTYVPLIADDNTYGWAGITFTGSFPGKHIEVVAQGHHWVRLSEFIYDERDDAMTAMVEEPSIELIY